MTEHKHYLSAGGNAPAMQITRSGTLTQGGTTKPTQILQYLHHDHLGSVAVVTDETGSVVERLAFDPWGKRRFPNDTADSNDTIVGLTLDRGFTMHEHLDEMGLIHMNGRIYDPLIGRFMGADPFIQAPENLQSHNRFAYVMNNPLSYTDPSGYFSLKKFFKKLIKTIVVRTILAVADTFCGGCASIAYNAYQAYRSGGVVGLVANVLGFDANPLGRAAVGCISAASNGGSCGRGAISAEVRSLGGNELPGQMLAGCVSARINGGSCGSGAENAFISYAAEHVSKSAVDIYREAEKQATQENFNRSLVACGLACPIIFAPEIVGAASFLWNATRAYFAVRGISRLLTANEAVNGGESVPPLPDKLVGEQGEKAGVSNSGNRHNSGHLTSENGGSGGDGYKDFDRLGGGNSRPAGGTYPEGTRIAPNGVVIRPGRNGGPPRIEIPGNGTKLPETLHYLR